MISAFFNDESHTYLHPATGSRSTLDLTLCDPSLYLDFSWKVGDDLCGSDHFPVFLQRNGPPSVDRVQRWKLNKADWETFRAECMIELDVDRFPDDEDQMEHFTKLLHDIAKKTIPKTSANPKRFNKPCLTTIAKRLLNPERNRFVQSIIMQRLII